MTDQTRDNKFERRRRLVPSVSIIKRKPPPAKTNISVTNKVESPLSNIHNNTEVDGNLNPESNRLEILGIHKVASPGLINISSPGLTKAASPGLSRIASPVLTKILSPVSAKPVNSGIIKSPSPVLHRFSSPGLTKETSPGLIKIVSPSRIATSGSNKLASPGLNKTATPEFINLAGQVKVESQCINTNFTVDPKACVSEGSRQNICEVSDKIVMQHERNINTNNSVIKVNSAGHSREEIDCKGINTKKGAIKIISDKIISLGSDKTKTNINSNYGIIKDSLNIVRKCSVIKGTDINNSTHYVDSDVNVNTAIEEQNIVQNSYDLNRGKKNDKIKDKPALSKSSKVFVLTPAKLKAWGINIDSLEPKSKKIKNASDTGVSKSQDMVPPKADSEYKTTENIKKTLFNKLTKKINKQQFVEINNQNIKSPNIPNVTEEKQLSSAIPPSPNISNSTNMETISHITNSLILSPGNDIAAYIEGYKKIEQTSQPTNAAIESKAKLSDNIQYVQPTYYNACVVNSSINTVCNIQPDNIVESQVQGYISQDNICNEYSSLPQECFPQFTESFVISEPLIELYPENQSSEICDTTNQMMILENMSSNIAMNDSSATVNADSNFSNEECDNYDSNDEAFDYTIVEVNSDEIGKIDLINVEDFDVEDKDNQLESGSSNTCDDVMNDDIENNPIIYMNEGDISFPDRKTLPPFEAISSIPVIKNYFLKENISPQPCNLNTNIEFIFKTLSKSIEVNENNELVPANETLKEISYNNETADNFVVKTAIPSNLSITNSENVFNNDSSNINIACDVASMSGETFGVQDAVNASKKMCNMEKESSPPKQIVKVKESTGGLETNVSVKSIPCQWTDRAFLKSNKVDKSSIGDSVVKDDDIYTDIKHENSINISELSKNNNYVNMASLSSCNIQESDNNHMQVNNISQKDKNLKSYSINKHIFSPVCRNADLMHSVKKKTVEDNFESESKKSDDKQINSPMNTIIEYLKHIHSKMKRNDTFLDTRNSQDLVKDHKKKNVPKVYKKPNEIIKTENIMHGVEKPGGIADTSDCDTSLESSSKEQISAGVNPHINIGNSNYAKKIIHNNSKTVTNNSNLFEETSDCDGSAALFNIAEPKSSHNSSLENVTDKSIRTYSRKLTYNKSALIDLPRTSNDDRHLIEFTFGDLSINAHLSNSFEHDLDEVHNLNFNFSASDLSSSFECFNEFDSFEDQYTDKHDQQEASNVELVKHIVYDQKLNFKEAQEKLVQENIPLNVISLMDSKEDNCEDASSSQFKLSTGTIEITNVLNNEIEEANLNTETFVNANDQRYIDSLSDLNKTMLGKIKYMSSNSINCNLSESLNEKDNDNSTNSDHNTKKLDKSSVILEHDNMDNVVDCASVKNSNINIFTKNHQCFETTKVLESINDFVEVLSFTIDDSTSLCLAHKENYASNVSDVCEESDKNELLIMNEDLLDVSLKNLKTEFPSLNNTRISDIFECNSSQVNSVNCSSTDILPNIINDEIEEESSINDIYLSRNFKTVDSEEGLPKETNIYLEEVQLMETNIDLEEVEPMETNIDQEEVQLRETKIDQEVQIMEAKIDQEVQPIETNIDLQEETLIEIIASPVLQETYSVIKENSSLIEPKDKIINLQTIEFAKNESKISNVENSVSVNKSKGSDLLAEEICGESSTDNISNESNSNICNIIENIPLPVQEELLDKIIHLPDEEQDNSNLPLNCSVQEIDTNTAPLKMSDIDLEINGSVVERASEKTVCISRRRRVPVKPKLRPQNNNKKVTDSLSKLSVLKDTHVKSIEEVSNCIEEVDLDSIEKENEDIVSLSSKLPYAEIEIYKNIKCDEDSSLKTLPEASNPCSKENKASENQCLQTSTNLVETERIICRAPKKRIIERIKIDESTNKTNKHNASVPNTQDETSNKNINPINSLVEKSETLGSFKNKVSNSTKIVMSLQNEIINSTQVAVQNEVINNNQAVQNEIINNNQVAVQNEVINNNQVDQNKIINNNQVAVQNEVINNSQVVVQNEIVNNNQVVQNEIINNNQVAVQNEVINNSQVVVQNEIINNQVVQNDIINNNQVTVQNEVINNNQVTVQNEVINNNEVVVQNEIVNNNQVVQNEIINNNQVAVQNEIINNNQVAIQNEIIKSYQVVNDLNVTKQSDDSIGKGKQDFTDILKNIVNECESSASTNENLIAPAVDVSEIEPAEDCFEDSNEFDSAIPTDNETISSEIDCVLDNNVEDVSIPTNVVSEDSIQKHSKDVSVKVDKHSTKKSKPGRKKKKNILDSKEPSLLFEPSIQDNCIDIPTQGISVNPSIEENNSNALSVQENCASTPSIQDNSENPPLKRKRGRPRKYNIEFQDEVKEVVGEKESDEEEPLSKIARRKPSEKVKCAVCSKTMKYSNWDNHSLHQHKYLAWIEGDKPLNLKNQPLIVALVTKAYKLKVKLTCDKCKESRASVLGYLSHISVCQKTEEEINAYKQPCPICNNLIFPQSMRYHISTHDKPIEVRPVEVNKNDNVEEDVDVESETGVGRRKRKAAVKADESFKLIKNDIETQNVADMYNKPWSGKVIPAVVTRWRKKFASVGEVICCRPKCEHRETTMEGMLQHYLKTCKFMPLKVYSCKFCKYTNELEDVMSNHVKEKHVDKLTNNTDANSDSDNHMLSSDSSSDDDCDDDDDDDDEGEDEDDKRNKSGVSSKRIRRQFKFTAFPNFGLDNAFIKYINPYKKWMKQLIDKTYSTSQLFPDMCCNEYVPLSLEDGEEYLPDSIESCNVAIVKETKKNNADLNWEKFKLFQTSLHEGVQMFWCGGPVHAVSWVPGNRERQYLAVAADRYMNNRYIENTTHSHKSLLQIWDMGELNNSNVNCESLPVLKMCIAHDYGVIWNLCWCPSGCDDDLSSSGSVTRMGLLAAACSNGMAYIFAICNPETVSESGSHFYKTEPVGVLTLYKDKNSIDRQQATKVFWSQDKGHKIIVVGYSNGLVAYYNVASNSPLLVSRENNTKVYLPYYTFQPHTKPILGLVLLRSLDVDSPVEEAPLAVCSSVSSSIWCDRSQQYFKRGLYSGIVFSPHFPEVMFCSDEIHTNKACTVVVGNGATVSNRLVISGSRPQRGCIMPWSANNIYIGSHGQLIQQEHRSALVSKLRNLKRQKNYKALLYYHAVVGVDQQKFKIIQEPKEDSKKKPQPVQGAISNVPSYKEISDKYGLVVVNVPKSSQISIKWSDKEHVLSNLSWPLWEQLTIDTPTSEICSDFTAVGGRAGFCRVQYVRPLFLCNKPIEK